MQNIKIYSILVFAVFISTITANSVEYEDLDSYKYRIQYAKPRQGFLESLFLSGWNAVHKSAKESFVAQNIESKAFWDAIRSSLEDGTFYNLVAGYKTANNNSGSDIFLQTIYASINKIPVKYKSVSPTGDSIMLSGKIFLPKSKEAKNIIIANHYTICSNSEAPSNANSIEGIFASKDYIVLMPDYIGYGISDSLPHPYLHLESAVRSAIDMLNAAIPYLRAKEYTYNPSLILIGYSQGAAATLALQKTLEEQYSNQFTIKQVFAGAGPYDLASTYDFYIGQQTMDIPCSMPMLVLGMDYGEGLGLKREDFFQPALLNKCPKLIESKRMTMTEVNAELGNNINLLFKPIIYHTDSFPTTVLYEAVCRNCIIQWTPKSKLFLFHSTEDNMVPFLNSERLKTEFDKQQLENIQYDFAPYGNHMRAAVYFFEKVYKQL